MQFHANKVVIETKKTNSLHAPPNPKGNARPHNRRRKTTPPQIHQLTFRTRIFIRTKEIGNPGQRTRFHGNIHIFKNIPWQQTNWQDGPPTRLWGGAVTARVDRPVGEVCKDILLWLP